MDSTSSFDMTSKRREQRNLITELLSAFRSQEYPWKSNLEAIQEIVEGIMQPIAGPESERLKIDFSSTTLDDGQKRYHDRAEQMQRAKDPEDLKAVVADLVQTLAEYNKAAAEAAVVQQKLVKCPDKYDDTWPKSRERRHGSSPAFPWYSCGNSKMRRRC